MSENNHSENEQPQSYGPRKFIARPKICQFCADKNVVIDYKNTDLLRRYVTEDGKIRPRRQTGTCARHQRALAIEIKRARHIALLPFVGESWSDYR
ncbi:MAG TPA: 30S ribosomal protein S18 [Bellilinea sp.]|jgi:small subunit ribosomal protein S18|nr:30S ribosomal protein S18 [Bellilinea sp.]